MEMKFEDAIKRLEDIVNKLERGDVPLDDALKLYEEGQQLIKFCKEKLLKVEAKVKELIKLSEKHFDTQEIEIKTEERDNKFLF